MQLGRISHFGHTHYRRNRYDAEMNITSTNGVWENQKMKVAYQRREL